MMIERNRPNLTAEEAARLYEHPHDATQWAEHILRSEVTAHLARYRWPTARIAIDPAAGTNRTGRVIEAAGGIDVVTGDLSPSAPVDYPGTDAVELLERLVHLEADYVVLGEILEHVNDPEALLTAARKAAGGLILSTPWNEPAHVNPEHLWRWDTAGVLELLDRTAWRPLDYTELRLEEPGGYPVRFQIHTAERR